METKQTLTLANNSNYYIQRLRAVRNWKTNIDGYFNYNSYYENFSPYSHIQDEYMGSAEYEFGALNNTYNWFKENIDQLSLFVYNYKAPKQSRNTTLYILAPTNTDPTYITNLFDKIIDFKHRTKERTDIYDAFIDKDETDLFLTTSWMNLITHYSSDNETPWFATIDSAIMFWFLVHAFNDKGQTNTFKQASVGTKVYYPFSYLYPNTDKPKVCSVSEVKGVSEDRFLFDSVLVKETKKSKWFNHYQAVLAHPENTALTTVLDEIYKASNRKSCKTNGLVYKVDMSIGK